MRKKIKNLLGLVIVLVMSFSMKTANAQSTFPHIEVAKLSWQQCPTGGWVKRCLYGSGSCGASDQMFCDEIHPH
jgi:hypothetical protein